jgi:hypothetical protein
MWRQPIRESVVWFPLRTRLNWPPSAPLCDDMADWRVLLRFHVILHLYFIKATRKLSVITSREDVRTCGPQPRGKCNSPRGGMPEYRCTIFPPPDLLCTFPLKSYRGRGYEGYVDSAKSLETEVLRFHWITCAIRDKIFDKCTRGGRSVSCRFAWWNPYFLLTMRDGYVLSYLGVNCLQTLDVYLRDMINSPK